MRTSESIVELTKALLEAQRCFPVVVKDSDNPHFKSRFASLCAIWQAVKQHLHKNGLVIVNGVSSTDGKDYIATRLVHVSGEFIESVFPLPANANSQANASAISYGKRYNLSALLGVTIDDDDDDGEMAVGRGAMGMVPPPVQAPVRQPVTAPARTAPTRVAAPVRNQGQLPDPPQF